MMHFLFKPLSLKDLPRLESWFQGEHIKPWYNGAELSRHALWVKYLPRIQGTEPIDCYMIMYGNVKIGFIQYYAAQDFLSYDMNTCLPENLRGKSVASLDFFLGSGPFLSKGYSSVIVKMFLHQFIFPRFEVCFIDPDPQNIRAIKCYQKVGFKTLKIIDVHSDQGLEKVQLMIFTEADFKF
jgi:RimJ/RimL family protein N-acetyltransferase